MTGYKKMSTVNSKESCFFANECPDSGIWLDWIIGKKNFKSSGNNLLTGKGSKQWKQTTKWFSNVTE
jgi:hypothetical protein